MALKRLCRRHYMIDVASQPDKVPAMSTVNSRPAGAEARLPVRIPKSVTRDMLLLASIWVVSLFVVNPIGDFPLNDDWSFGLSVKRLLQTGDFRPTGWTSMTLITQTLWGFLFCLPAGFSFTALRLSTLLLSLCSVLVVYLLVRQVHPSRLLATVAALTVGFNPISYALSNTFMTDVPFTALLLVAAWFFARTLQTGSDFALLCGLACALAATLCRQLGLAAPIAFAACLLWSRGTAPRWLIRAVVPVAICFGALLAFQHWLRATGRIPALFTLKNQVLFPELGNPRALVSGLAKHIGTALLYLGWFSLPVTILALPAVAAARRNRRAFMIACCAGCTFVLGSALILILTRGPMPTAGNIVLSQGIGPLSLRDMHILNLPHVPTIGKGFWLVVTAAALLGGALLVGAAAGWAAMIWPSLKPTRIQPDQIAGIFFLLCGGVYLAPILVIGGWDRYYIPALPFLLIGIAALASTFWAGQTRARLALAVLLLGSLSVYAVFGTRDYLAWNRVRWTALHDLLVTEKVTPADIDGGFEFNGLYLYDPAYKEDPAKSWYWVDRDSYLLAFAEMPGFTAIKQYKYSHWLPPYTGRIFVLKKDSLQEPNHPGPTSTTPTAPPNRRSPP
jgi:4-amino-4-deoxy-L-arabinose transferase-like glycosyltransferase